MIVVGSIFGAVALLLITHLWSTRDGYARGYDHGFKEGKECGRAEAETWWLEQGVEVEQARAALNADRKE